ncbi:hypothetical protein AVEN_239499-1 [Araneus ventricosus]|uniref:Uncharacterized protein n=1 Tax=Araneus ventricosus TaxID=182803 RepID=A0A4Y2IJI9_ARAVE|nr:hypothetical protein AVEN_239499-1 [Araneus ventricosus]
MDKPKQAQRGVIQFHCSTLLRHVADLRSVIRRKRLVQFSGGVILLQDNTRHQRTLWCFPLGSVESSALQLRSSSCDYRAWLVKDDSEKSALYHVVKFA